MCVYCKFKESTLEFEDVLSYVDRCVFEYADRHLNDIEQGIIRWTYEGLSYEQMAVRMAYGSSTLRGVYGYQLWQLLKRVWPDENVNKSRFRKVIDRLYQEDLDLSRNNRQQSSVPNTSNLDLKIIPENNANGIHRKALLSRLVQTLKSGGQVLLLTGAKGIGKSYLIESLSLELSNHFVQVIHHSIHEAATWQTCYQELSALGLLDLNNEPANKAPISERQMRQQVLQVLYQSQYLIIIDQSERFREDPKQEVFFQEITTAINCQSSILWVSAIRPVEINRRVAVETLKGLPFDEANVLLRKEYPYLSDSLSRNEVHWKQLVKLCGGNPYLLHKSVETLKSFYTNQIQQFTAYVSSIPLSHRYFETLMGELSEAERTLLNLFAFRPLSWVEVQDWPLLTILDQEQLMQAWYMLHRRHLLECFSETDSVYQITPPYLGLYLLQRLKEILLQELIDENLKLFHTYPLSLPTASVEQQKILKNYLLIPIANTLRYRFSLEALQAKLSRLISQLAALPLPSRSYAAGSLFNLATHMGLSLMEVSWANLTLWHIDFRVRGLQGLDFQGCQFRQAVLETGLCEPFVMALHPDGTAMAIGDAQGFLQVYQWDKHKFILAWCNNIGIPIQQIIITDSNMLIVTLIDQNIQIWDDLAHKDQVYNDVSGVAAICSVDLNTNDSLLAIGLSNREIQLWNLMLGAQVGMPLHDANDIVRHLRFSPDGRILAGYDNNNLILVWHYNATNNTYTIAGTPLPLARYGHLLAFQWMGTQLLHAVEAVPDDDSQERLSKVTVRSFTVTEQTLAEDSIDFSVRELETNFSQPYQAVFSKNGKYLAVCDMDHTVRLWRDMLLADSLSITLPDLPECLYVSNDGQQLLCQSISTISVWNLETQEVLQDLKVVSDLDQYRDCKFYTKQGFSNSELQVVKRLGGVVVE